MWRFQPVVVVVVAIIVFTYFVDSSEVSNIRKPVARLQTSNGHSTSSPPIFRAGDLSSLSPTQNQETKMGRRGSGGGGGGGRKAAPPPSRAPARSASTRAAPPPAKPAAAAPPPAAAAAAPAARKCFQPSLHIRERLRPRLCLRSCSRRTLRS
jgi:hypothetical protein